LKFFLVGLGSSTIESLQFSLAIIEVATNNFADDNKIGKGGFGEVYKVTKIVILVYYMLLLLTLIIIYFFRVFLLMEHL